MSVFYRLCLNRASLLIGSRSYSTGKTKATNSTSLVDGDRDFEQRIKDYDKMNELIEPPTHTGAEWASEDYRRARFLKSPEKLVNTSFAIDLISEVPPIACKERITHCDGGGGPLGHPRVFINLDKPGNHTCGYCGLRFYKEDHHH